MEKMVILLLGLTAALVATGLLVGGGALLWVDANLTDAQGFINSEPFELHTETHALVTEPAEIDFEPAGPLGHFEAASLRVAVSSTDPAQGIFIGLAGASAVSAYLSDVEHDMITEFSTSPYRVDYERYPGTSIPEPPASQTFWRASSHDGPNQTLEWELEPGNYTFVVMNGDGSAGVDAEAIVGVRVPLMRQTGAGLLAAGTAVLVVGSVLILLAL